MVQPDDEPPARAIKQASHRYPGAATQLKHAVGRLYVEQVDSPAVPLKIRSSMGHDPSGSSTAQPRRLVKLLHDTPGHTLADLHWDK
jgi:hypothetical protein